MVNMNRTKFPNRNSIGNILLGKLILVVGNKNI